MDLLFLDTETTGAMPGEDRLVSLAYKTKGKRVHELFKPEKPISLDAMAVHHITPEMVEDKPAFQQSTTKQELEQLLSNHILVAHNAMFDIAMLEAEGLTVPQFICTLKLARAMDPEGEIPRHRLQYLRYYWKLPVGSGEEAVAHSADGDVLVLEALYNYIEQQMRKEYADEAQLQEAMLDISIRPSLVHRFRFGKYRDMKLADVVQKDPGYLEWLLGEKELAAAAGRDSDPDFIYSLKHFLGRSA